MVIGPGLVPFTSCPRQQIQLYCSVCTCEGVCVCQGEWQVSPGGSAGGGGVCVCPCWPSPAAIKLSYTRPDSHPHSHLPEIFFFTFSLNTSFSLYVKVVDFQLLTLLFHVPSIHLPAESQVSKGMKGKTPSQSCRVMVYPASIHYKKCKVLSVPSTYE